MTGILRFYLRNLRFGWNDCFTVANDRNNDDGSVDKGISRPRSFLSSALFHNRDPWRSLGFLPLSQISLMTRPIVSYNPRRGRTHEVDSYTRGRKGKERDRAETERKRRKGQRMGQRVARKVEAEGQYSAAVIIRPLWSTQWTVEAQFRVKYGSINGEPL